MQNSATVEKILLQLDPEKTNLLLALKKISAAFGCVTKDDAQKLADYFSLPLAQIYETASFYDLIKLNKAAILEIRVCSGGDCALGRSAAIIREIENYFKIKSGDGFNPKVSLEIISCLGRCADGPIMIVNDQVFEKVSVNSVHEILRNY
jgi:NADH-quinone oxidoreductase subunit E